MLLVHQSDVSEFSLLGYALYFQLGLVAIIVGGLMFRRSQMQSAAQRLLLLASCVVFLWPLSYYNGRAAWKVGLPCLLIAVVGLLPAAAYTAPARRAALAASLVVAGLGSAALMVFNDLLL